MKDCEPVKVPILVGIKLSTDQCPKSQEEIEYMEHVPYTNVVDSRMYSMVYTEPYIAHAMGVLRRYMMTLGREHWTTIIRVLRYLRGTTNFTIGYHRNYEEVRVHIFIDSNQATNIDGRW